VVSAVLVTLLGLQVLPWGCVECAPAVPGGDRGRICTVEPLQVCDDGDSFLGILFDLPVLLPGSPCLFPSTETLPLVQQAAAFVPDGFLPAIDHPPQLFA
jgi:hypothetical protein